MEEETKITPTVGRMVYYKATEGVLPAVITGVHSETCINLQVFNNCEGVAFRSSVVNGQNNGQWDWMPYQKGQAKKTEELEEKLENNEGQTSEV